MILNGYQELIKTKCPELPVFIITHNNPSYLQMMITQLKNYNLTNIIVLDNSSSTEKMLEVLDEVSKEFTVVKNTTNYGPWLYWQEKSLWDWLPNNFILTDPDIGFNENLPQDFVEVLSALSDSFSLYKVGFALDIFLEVENILDMPYNGGTNFEWELNFWNHVLVKADANDVYIAPIDTTFAFYNKSNYRGDNYGPSARVAGNYTAQHYGWYKSPPITREELRDYVETIPTSSFSTTKDAIEKILSS